MVVTTWPVTYVVQYTTSRGKTSSSQTTKQRCNEEVHIQLLQKRGWNRFLSRQSFKSQHDNQQQYNIYAIGKPADKK